jgi:hypothetical protein
MKVLLVAISSAICVWGQQQPQVENAKLETRTFAGSLASQLFVAWRGSLLGRVVGADHSRQSWRHVLVER